MSTPFEEMTNKELAQAVEDFGIDVEAKNPAKPNKTEYVTALNAFKEKQDAIHGKVDEAEDTEEATVDADEPTVEVDGEVVAINASKPAVLLRADLLRKERVIVTDLRESQTREPSITVSWGNRAIGNRNDLISLNGEPQYIRRGAILNLEAARLTLHEPDESGADKMQVRNRYVITRVKGFSAKELAALGAKQNMRDAKH